MREELQIALAHREGDYILKVSTAYEDKVREQILYAPAGEVKEVIYSETFPQKYLCSPPTDVGLFCKNFGSYFQSLRVGLLQEEKKKYIKREKSTLL